MIKQIDICAVYLSGGKCSRIRTYTMLCMQFEQEGVTGLKIA